MYAWIHVRKNSTETLHLMPHYVLPRNKKNNHQEDKFNEIKTVENSTVLGQSCRSVQQQMLSMTLCPSAAPSTASNNYIFNDSQTNKPVGDWITAPSPNFVATATRVGPTTFCMVPLNQPSL